MQLYSGAGAKIPGGELARYGASPARFDLFVEVDYNGDTPVAGGCSETGVGTTAALSRVAATRVAQQYRNTTSASLPNRDGSAGIWAHFDIGSSSTDPPLATDTDGGDWGGSGCFVDRPACVANAQCLGSGGTCCLTSGGCVVDNVEIDQNECIAFDPRLHFMTPARRWLFRSAFMFQGSVGGNTRLCGMLGYQAGSATLVHELGHQGCLMHQGPNNVRLGSVGNDRVNYITRMSYTYDYVGGTALSGADAPRVSFSSGLLPDLRPLAVSEQCPLNTSDRYDIIENYSSSHSGFVDLAPTCPNIDFNHDGVFSTTAGVTVEARLAGGAGRTFREEIGPDLWLHESGPELVVAGSLIYRFRVAGSESGGVITPQLQYSARTGFTCAENPAATGDRFPACPFAGGVENILSDGGFRPVAVAADAITFAGAARVALVWRTTTNQLRTGHLQGTTWLPGSNISGTGTLATRSSGNGFPAVARIGGTQTVLLTYRNAAGDVMEMEGQYVGSTWTWGSPAVALSNADGSIVGSPSLTTAESTTLASNGVLMLIGRRPPGGSFALEIWHRDASGWTPQASMPQSGTQMWGRGNISIRPYRVGGATRERAFVAWRAASAVAGESTNLAGYVTVGPNDSLSGTWTSRNQFVNFDNGTIAHAFSIDTVWDTRTTTGARGLRGVWGEFYRCAGTCPSGSTCQVLAGGSATLSACTTPDGLIQARERRAPGADGVVPMVSEDFNEWLMMRHAYCATLRDEAMTWAPTAYRENRNSCAPVPDYGL